MCGSMIDIQSAVAEIRRGIKKDRKIETTGQKYNGPLLHRAAINSIMCWCAVKKLRTRRPNTSLESAVAFKPRLHDTTGCTTGLTTGVKPV